MGQRGHRVAIRGHCGGDGVAFIEAHAHLERVLSAWDRMPDPVAVTGIERLDLLERAANAAYFGASRQRAVELASAAIDEVDAGADPRRAALCLAKLGRNVSGGDLPAAFEALQRAAALLPQDPPTVERARVLAEQARVLMMMSRDRDAEILARAAITMAHVLGARAEEGHATNTLGCCLSALGQANEGIALVRAALEIAEELASPDDLNRAYNNLSSVLSRAGRLQEAAAVVLDAVAVGEDLGGIRLEGAALNSAEALIDLGQWEQAEALPSGRGDLPGICVNSFELLTARLALRQGRIDAAGRALSAADGATARLSDVQARGTYHLLQAERALEERRHRDASEEVERALTLAAGSDDEILGPEMCALGVRALADAQDDARAGRVSSQNDAEKRRLLASGLAQEADRLVAGPVERGMEGSPQAKAFALLCRAEASRLHGSDPAAWQAAATAWQQLSMPYEAAYCHWRGAAALLASAGERRRASELLCQAWRTSHDLGALPLRAKIERLAQRARIPLSPDGRSVTPESSVTSDLGLTAREVEVLAQLAAGRTDAQIAEQLFISKKTASVHVSNLLRKLGVANRIEAGEIGQQVGLA